MKKTGTIRGGFGLGTSLQYGVMVRPYETFSHCHDSYFMTHQIKWWSVSVPTRYRYPLFKRRFFLTTRRFGIFRLIIIWGNIYGFLWSWSFTFLLRISIHIFDSDLISQVHFFLNSLYVQDRDSLRREG